MSENPVEIWETTTRGGVWIIQIVDKHGTQKPKRIKGKPGYRVRITQADREASGMKFSEPKDDPFLNGTLKRVDAPVETVKEEIPDYDAEQALSDADLLVLFASSGNAFQSKVKKLNERNARRLLAIGEENAEAVTTAQREFLDTYIVETYRPGGAPKEPEQI